MVRKSRLLAFYLALVSVTISCKRQVHPRAEIGMTEAEVIERLRSPNETVFPPFESDGFARDKRIVKVLLYRGSDPESYKVALDANGVVVQTSFGLAIP
jgi:hypothetical protein